MTPNHKCTLTEPETPNVGGSRVIYPVIPTLINVYELLKIKYPHFDAHTVVERNLAAGHTGYYEITIPRDYVDIQKNCIIWGDGVVLLEISVDFDDQIAIPEFSVPPVPDIFEFSRWWEKTIKIRIKETNTDVTNPAKYYFRIFSVLPSVLKWDEIKKRMIDISAFLVR